MKGRGGWERGRRAQERVMAGLVQDLSGCRGASRFRNRSLRCYGSCFLTRFAITAAMNSEQTAPSKMAVTKLLEANE